MDGKGRGRQMSFENVLSRQYVIEEDRFEDVDRLGKDYSCRYLQCLIESLSIILRAPCL
jgi:hypothetical protein